MSDQGSGNGDSLLKYLLTSPMDLQGETYLLSSGEPRRALVAAFCLEPVGKRFNELKLFKCQQFRQGGLGTPTILASRQACSNSSSVTCSGGLLAPSLLQSVSRVRLRVFTGATYKMLKRIVPPYSVGSWPTSAT